MFNLSPCQAHCVTWSGNVRLTVLPDQEISGSLCYLIRKCQAHFVTWSGNVRLTVLPDQEMIETDWSITSSNSSELYWAILYGSTWLAMVAGHIHKFPTSPDTNSRHPLPAWIQINTHAGLNNISGFKQRQVKHGMHIYAWSMHAFYKIICQYVVCLVVCTMTHWLMQFTSGLDDK